MSSSARTSRTGYTNSNEEIQSSTSRLFLMLKRSRLRKPWLLTTFMLRNSSCLRNRGQICQAYQWTWTSPSTLKTYGKLSRTATITRTYSTLKTFTYTEASSNSITSATQRPSKTSREPARLTKSACETSMGRFASRTRAASTRETRPCSTIR